MTNLYGGDGFLQKSIALEAAATNTYVFQNGELSTLTTPLGLTVSLTHDYLGRLTGVSFPDSTTLSYVFGNLDVVAAKDRRGHWSYATYDSMRQLRTLIDRNGGTNGFSYCDCGSLTSVTNAQGQVSTFGRDYLGRVTSIATGAGTVSIARDNLGQPTHVTSDWNLNLWLGHNYQGLLTAITNPAGTALSVVYDEADLPVSVNDARGVTITSTFDTLGRLLTRSNPRGQTDYNDYSAQGIIDHFDALGKESFYGYDSAGRLCAVTNANGEVTQVGYDVPHRQVSLTDGRYNTKWWAFDIK